MLCDYYELTMANGYYRAGMSDSITYFDMFFRDIPDGGGFAIAAGLEQLIEYINNLEFTDEDIEYLRSKNCLRRGISRKAEDLPLYRRHLCHPGGHADLSGRADHHGTRACGGGTVHRDLSPADGQPPVADRHQSKPHRAAPPRGVRSPSSAAAAHRAADGAYLGARAAYIGGCAATACTITDRDFGVPATGTMAHSWVQMFDSEYEAFKTYCELYPTNATLLVDTYNTLKSGVPNAIRVFKEVLLPKGITKCAIRLDSGDIAYLSKKARKMLDDAGLTECKIVASNSLDEDIILALIRQGAAVDAFGVGERMITAKSAPVFGGVYKLCAREEPDGTIIPKIKISENAAKITNPHYKKVYRLFDKENGKAIADYIAVHDEVVDGSAPIELFDPDYTWKRKTVTDYTVRELQVPIFLGGKCVYQSPSTTEIRDYCAKEVDTLWDEVKRFENPHNYYVDLSQKLWDIKHELLKQGNK